MLIRGNNQKTELVDPSRLGLRLDLGFERLKRLRGFRVRMNNPNRNPKVSLTLTLTFFVEFGVQIEV